MSDLTLAVAQTVAVPRDVERNVSAHVRLASLAAANGARFVLFPELSLVGYEHGLTLDDAIDPADHRLQPLRAVADAHDITIVAGAPLASSPDLHAGGLQVEGLHIGTVTFEPRMAVSTYAKQYLHGGEDAAFVPGCGGAPLALFDETVALAICADIMHPEHVDAAAGAGASIYAAGCLLTEQCYEADVGLLRNYAKEHRLAVLMANYGAPLGEWHSAGKSAIWSSDGALVVCAPPEGEAVALATKSSGRSSDRSSESSSESWNGRVVL